MTMPACWKALRETNDPSNWFVDTGARSSADCTGRVQAFARHCDVDPYLVQNQWLDHIPDAPSALARCWMTFPACKNPLRETTDPSNWFVDTSSGSSAVCTSRVPTFAQYCGVDPSMVQNQWLDRTPPDAAPSRCWMTMPVCWKALRETKDPSNWFVDTGAGSSADCTSRVPAFARHCDVDPYLVQNQWLDHIPEAPSALARCWMTFPACKNPLRETTDPSNWFVDTSSGSSAVCTSRVPVFAQYCGVDPSMVQNQWLDHIPAEEEEPATGCDIEADGYDCNDGAGIAGNPVAVLRNLGCAGDPDMWACSVKKAKEACDANEKCKSFGVSAKWGLNKAQLFSSMDTKRNPDWNAWLVDSDDDYYSYDYYSYDYYGSF